MMPFVRRALARALIVLVPLTALAAPAVAQFGFQPPTGPATAGCSPFGGFPMSLNLGQRADGLDGISSRCGFQRVQDGLNTLAGQKGQPGGIATLNAAGVVPISQIPATVALPTAVPSLTITGSGSSGAIDGMSVTSPDANASPVSLATRIQNSPLIAADYGIKCDGTSDDAANIRYALSVARNRPNPTLQLPSGVCAIGSTIQSPDWSNVALIGFGGGTGAGTNANAQDGTVLKWTGGIGGTMLDWQSPSATRTNLTASSVIHGITLDGNGKAATGLFVRGLYNSRLGIKVRNVTTVGVDIDIYSGGGADVQRNTSDYINVDLGFPASVNATGIKFGPGSSYNDIHHDIWSGLAVIHQAGTGIEIGNVDTDTFIGVQAQYPVDGTGTRTGPGLVFMASPGPLGPGGVSQAARDNILLNVSIASGTFSRAGNNGLPSHNNMIFGFVQGSSEPSPVIDAGATLNWVSSLGDWHIQTIYPRQQVWKSPGDYDVLFENQIGATVGYFGTDGILAGVPTDALRIRGSSGVAIGANNNASVQVDQNGYVTFPQIVPAASNAAAAAAGVPLGALFYNTTSSALSLRQ